MKEEQLIELIHKRATQELTQAEGQLLNSLLENKEYQTIASEIESVWEKSLDYQKDFQPNVEKGLSKFKARIQQEHTPATKVVKMQSRRSWMRVAAAAAILIVGSWLAWDTFNTNTNWQNFALTDTIKNLDLEDGSKVSINSNSTFSYPTKFDDNQRLVKLEGEAFFDIAKNPQKPFIIESGDLQIKVLGTSFNVRNFDNENSAQITVRSGRVEVSSKNSKYKVILEANDRLVFDKRKRKARGVSKDENLNDLAWWSGKIEFPNMEKVSRIIEVVEHAYNLKLEVVNKEMLKCNYTISNDIKGEGIEQILTTFKLGLGFEVEKISNKKYRLAGGNCVRD